MKRLSMVLASMLVLSAGSLFAQEVPKFEIFGGGSVLNIHDNNFKLTPFGWAASVAANMNKMFGIVGDVGGNYRDGNHFHSFLGGAQLSHRLDSISGFAQAKAGLLHNSDIVGGTNNLQLGFGGGVDWRVNKKVAIRLIQFDWLPTKASNGWVTNMTRGSVGIVFRGESK